MGKTTNNFAPEVRERTLRIVLWHAGNHPSRWAEQPRFRRCGASLERLRRGR